MIENHECSFCGKYGPLTFNGQRWCRQCFDNRMPGVAYKGYPPQLDHDPVNHPSHYTNHPSGVECIQITRHMGFNIGNVVKYLWRAGLKDSAPTLQDLKKAAWYLNDEIKKMEKGQ